MPLDFYKDGYDTGSALGNAIQPITDGETLVDTNLNRSPDNLRNRTEVLREVFNFQELLSRSDRGLIVFSDANTRMIVHEVGALSGKYGFKLNLTGDYDDPSDRDLIIGSIVSPSKLTGTAPIRAKLVHLDTSADAKFSLLSKKLGGIRRVAEGAHNILFRIYKESGENTILVSIEGAANESAPDPEVGPVTIAVRIAADDSSTVAGLVTAINTHTGAQKLVYAAPISVDTLCLTQTMTTPVRLYEDATTSESIGGIDDECFRVTAAAIDDHFLEENNLLMDGSFLVLDFATAKSRLVSTYNSTPTLLTIHASDDPGNTTNIAETYGTIPVCKMLGGYLYFLNGRAFAPELWDILIGSKKADLSLRPDLASATDPEKGDFLVGAEAKTQGSLPLPIGTVHSQLGNLAQLGSSVSGQGSSLVGSAVVTVGGITLPSGTLHSQLIQLVTQLVDDVTPDGASRIGAASYEHSGVTLGAGSVSSQLHTIIDRVVDHTKGTGYYHTIGHIQLKPFVVVHPTPGSGDYETIGAGINAVKTNGGTVFVYPGTYAESYNGGDLAVSKPIHIIGFGNVVWNNVLSVANFTTSARASWGSTLTFENIKFASATATDVPFMSIGGTATEAGRIEFFNCVFSHIGVLGRFCNFEAPCRVVIENCYFSSTATFTTGRWAIGIDGAQVRLHRNKFYHCAGIAIIASGKTSKRFEASYNEFLECGYSTDLSVLNHLFNFDSVDNLLLVGNNYPDFTHSLPECRYALFLWVRLNKFALVHGNVMHPRIDLSGTPDVAMFHLLQFTGSEGAVFVQNNSFPNCLKCGAISFVGSTSKNFISGNSFLDMGYASPSSTLSMVDCSAGQSIVEGNYFKCKDVTDYFQIGLKIAGSGLVSENIITGNIEGVRVTGDATVIRGNYIETQNHEDARGVKFLAGTTHSYMTVSNNRIKSRSGIASEATGNLISSVITGNIVTILGVGNGTFLAGDYLTITDNVIDGTIGCPYGIYLAGHAVGHNIVKANRIMGPRIGVYCYTLTADTIVQDCNISIIASGTYPCYGVYLKVERSQAIGNIIELTGTLNLGYDNHGVYVGASESAALNNIIKGVVLGVKVNDAAGVQFVNVSGNRIEVVDQNNSVGIEVLKSGSVDINCFFTVNNNVISRAGRTNKTGSYGIKGNAYSLRIACAGNVIRHRWNNGGVGDDFTAAFTGPGTTFGLGEKNFTSNTDDFNVYDTA